MLEILFLGKSSQSKWDLKQIPQVNGGIVVMDPFNGEVKALVVVIVSCLVNLIELHRQKTARISFQTDRLRCCFREWIFTKLFNTRCPL